MVQWLEHSNHQKLCVWIWLIHVFVRCYQRELLLNWMCRVWPALRLNNINQFIVLDILVRYQMLLFKVCGGKSLDHCLIDYTEFYIFQIDHTLGMCVSVCDCVCVCKCVCVRVQDYLYLLPWIAWRESSCWETVQGQEGVLSSEYSSTIFNFQIR